jgi:hypothetical protein
VLAPLALVFSLLLMLCVLKPRLRLDPPWLPRLLEALLRRVGVVDWGVVVPSGRPR